MIKKELKEIDEESEESKSEKEENQELEEELKEKDILTKIRKNFEIKINSHKNVVKEKIGLFTFNSKYFINTKWILFLLLLIRIGPLISSPEYIFSTYEGQLSNITNWDDNQIHDYIQLPGFFYI
jgi:hypothetical protein